MARHGEKAPHLGGRSHGGGKRGGLGAHGGMGKKIHGMGAKMGKSRGGAEIEGPHEKELAHK